MLVVQGGSQINLSLKLSRKSYLGLAQFMFMCLCSYAFVIQLFPYTTSLLQYRTRTRVVIFSVCALYSVVYVCVCVWHECVLETSIYLLTSPLNSRRHSPSIQSRNCYLQFAETHYLLIQNTTTSIQSKATHTPTFKLHFFQKKSPTFSLQGIAQAHLPIAIFPIV